MSKNITDALSKLDPANENHWTQEGLPRLDTIKILAGDPSLTREAVTAAAPDFNRASAQQAAAGAQQAGAGTTPAAPTKHAPQGAASGPSASGPSASETPPLAPPAPPESDLPTLNPPPLAEVSDADNLNARIAEAKLQLSDAQDRLQLAKQDLSDAQNKVSDLEAQLKETSVGAANPITEYLKSQQRVLEERGVKRQLIRESGLNLKELAKQLKSPLDSAMERKNGRGGGRPVRS